MEPTLPQQPSSNPVIPGPAPQPNTGYPGYNSPGAPKSSKKMVILLLVLLVAALAVIGWLVFMKDDKANTQQSANTEHHHDTDEDESAGATQPPLSYQSQKVTSAKNRFTVEIPQGWNELIRPLDADQLMMAGTTQPTYSAGKAVTVTDMQSYGTDSPHVLTMLVHDNFGEPEGSEEDFSLPNNEKPITGKKYTKVYTDTVEGLGGHTKGEKFYNYRFPLKDGNTLYISYNVYTEDLKDQVSTVDEVVRSIVISN